jgi:hypothetical protein
VLEFASLAFTAAAIFQIGRWAKGRGDLTGALLLVSWLQFLILLLQVALVVIAVVVTQLAGLLTLTFPVLFGWLLTQFVMELHGFTSPWKVFVGIVAAFLGLCIVMTVILISFGIGV